NSLTPIASNDNDLETVCEPASSRITFTAIPGTIYYFAVDGVSGSVGNFGLRWGRAATISGNGSFLRVKLDGDACRQINNAGTFALTNVPTGGSYTISGNDPGVPTSIYITYGASGSLSPLTGDVSNVRFIQTTPTYGAAGVARTSDGSPISTGVTCANLNTEAPDTLRNTNTSGGNWSIGGLWNGSSYRCAPTTLSYTFNPTSVTVNGNTFNIVFTGAAAAYNVGGQVRYLDSATGVPDVLLAVSGGQTQTTISDTAGNYTLPGLPGG